MIHPIIGRYGLQRHSSVMLSVGSSMLSLFLALMMLAALAASYGEDVGFWFWILFLLKFSLFCVKSYVIHSTISFRF